jgi:tetratricopeptide (TPR) repeat protein
LLRDEAESQLNSETLARSVMSSFELQAELSRADELYQQRRRADAVSQSIDLLRGIGDGEECFEVQWRLARALFFIGQQAEPRRLKRQLHFAAVEAGRRAATIEPGRVEGHFWLGVNLALFAEASAGIRGVWALLRARRELRRAIQSCERYHAAGPWRVLARLEHKAPFLFGGSRARSRRHFARAIELAPHNSVTLLYAAELAIDEGDDDRAIELLQSIAKAPVDADWEFEYRRDCEIARMLIEQLQL